MYLAIALFYWVFLESLNLPLTPETRVRFPLGLPGNIKGLAKSADPFFIFGKEDGSAFRTPEGVS